jgi:hypothetical protein
MNGKDSHLSFDVGRKELIKTRFEMG